MAQIFQAKAVTVNAPGDNVIHTPASANMVRIHYICLSADYDNALPVLATVKFGATDASYRVDLGPGSIWSSNMGASRRFIQGAGDEALIVNLDSAQTLYVSIEFEDIP